MTKKRAVICQKCGNRFASKASNPRCSVCGSTRIIDEKETIPHATSRNLKRIEALEVEISELKEVILAFFDQDEKQKAHMKTQITELKMFEKSVDKGLRKTIEVVVGLRQRVEHLEA